MIMRRYRTQRTGFSLTELVVCASLLVTVMSFVTSIVIRVDRLWQDTRHQKIALDELSNHLEHLTTLDENEVHASLDRLEISEATRSSLPNATLEGEMVREAGSTQIVLTLSFGEVQSAGPPRHHPLSLTGFLSGDDAPPSVAADDQGGRP